MSTKKQTTSNSTQTATFDPASLAAYRTMTPLLTSFTNNWLGGGGNPTKTPGFNLLNQSAQKQAGAVGGRNIRNIATNALALGMNPNSPAFAAQIQRATRANSGLQQNAFLSTLQSAMQNQQFAASLANAYRPLQTGGTASGTSTETTSGLGTWLPQLASAGLGAATSFIKPTMPSAPPSSSIGAGSGYMGLGTPTNGSGSYWGS